MVSGHCSPRARSVAMGSVMAMAVMVMMLTVLSTVPVHGHTPIELKQKCVPFPTRCPDGKPTFSSGKQDKPVVPDGCPKGPLAASVPKRTLALLAPCCDQHTICYGTLHKYKDSCDFSLRECLEDACHSIDFEPVRVNPWAVFDRESCHKYRKLMMWETEFNGCKHWEDARKKYGCGGGEEKDGEKKDDE